MVDLPDEALACTWVDLAFEQEHVIEVVSEPMRIGRGTYVSGIRVSAGETGLYNVERLTPLTPNAARMLAA